MVAMMAVLTIAMSIPAVTAETKNNYTYSAYIPFPPLLQPVTWLDPPQWRYTLMVFGCLVLQMIEARLTPKRREQL